MRSAAVIQAAGKGSRFHSDQYKLLTPVFGVPMILRTLTPVIQAGFDDIVVVIGSHAAKMRVALMDLPVRIVENLNWENGQSTSLATGIRAVENSSDRACLMLGDQPFLQKETLLALLNESDRYPDEIIVPFCQEKRGNPIIVPSFRYSLLLELSHGDTGGRNLLKTVGYHVLSVEDHGIFADIDTTEDLNRFSTRDQEFGIAPGK